MIKQGFYVSSDDDHMSKNKDYYIHLQMDWKHKNIKH